MKTISNGSATAKAFAAVVAVLAIVTPPAGATVVSPPPRPTGGHMQWYRWHPSTRALEARTADFGSTAVVGLDSMRDLASLRAEYGFEPVRPIPALHAAQVRVDDGDVRELLAKGPDDPRVRYVSPVGPPRLSLALPVDPLTKTLDPTTSLPFEWQFASSRLERALELSPGSPAILVGTIDTGAADVPDLAGKVAGRWHFPYPESLIPQEQFVGNDEIGHGTAVASLIAASVDDGFGMAGFGGRTRVISFRDDILTDASIAVALTKLVSLGCRIVNMSLGAPRPDQPILVDALHKAAEAGVLLVAAAGNDHGPVNYPAADLQPAEGGPGYGLAVGASTADGSLASFSSFGRRLSLVAPGSYAGDCSGVLTAIGPFTPEFDRSCYPTWGGDGGARYAYLAGTSFSSPEVAGVAALVWAARPELRNDEVASILKESAQRGGAGWTGTMGCGVLDAAAALELATGSPLGRPLSACTAASAGPPTWPLDPPAVRAYRATGFWARQVSLPFVVTDGRDAVAAHAVVRKDGKVVATVAHSSYDISPDSAYTLGWKAPRAKRKGVYRFCVTVSSRTSGTSAPSCARIRMR